MKLRKFKISYNLTPDRIIRIFFLYITADLALTYFGVFQTEFRDFLSRYSIAIPLHITFYYWGRSEQATIQNMNLITLVQEKSANAAGEIELQISMLKKQISDMKRENKRLRERLASLIDLIEDEEDGDEISSFPEKK